MSKTEITYHRVRSDEELEAILKLQKANIKTTLSSAEQIKEGFVTVNHTLDLLERMNNFCPHMIAKHDGRVVAYALCMLESFRNDIPILIPMFTEIDKVITTGLRYIVMGQICVAKSYRGRGIFRSLYNYMVTELQLDFDLIITEVDASNTRSSGAHRSVGFKVLNTYQANDHNWELIGLEI